MHHATERPDWACQTHTPPRGPAWVPADRGYRTCGSCADHLRATLREIRERFACLDPRPGGGAPDGGRGAPGFGSRSPGSDHVIAMRDRRSRPTARVWRGSDLRVHGEPERPVLSVWAALHTIAAHIATQRGITNRALHRNDVDPLTRWVDSHLDWLTRQPDIAAHAAILDRLATQLRPVTGEPGGRRCVGRCPNTIDLGDDHTRECHARLYAPLHGDTIECAACGRAWTRPDWVRLGLMLTDPTQATA